MRVLVTGHNGYIGSVMTPVLQRAGHKVVGLDACFFEESTFGERTSNVASVRKDMRDVALEDLRGFDAVVHLAGLSNDPLGDLNPDLTFEINHAASIRLARLAKEAGVTRFLFSSSCSIYGAAADGVRNEEAPLCPLTPYAIAKVRTEEDLAKLADGSFTPVFMRNATAYGVSPRLRLDLVLNNLVGWAHVTGSVRILSDGTPWRPIVHVEDIAHAFAAALGAPKEVVHNQAFNVGVDEENYQVRDLAEIVREAVPGSNVEYGAGAGPDPRSYRVDFSRLHRAFPAFRPKWCARQGALELAAAFQSVGLSDKDFKGHKYVRLHQLQQLQDGGKLDATLRWKA